MIFEDRLSRPSLYPNENKRIEYKYSTYSVCKKKKVERQKVQRSMMRPRMMKVNDEMEVHDQIEMTRRTHGPKDPRTYGHRDPQTYRPAEPGTHGPTDPRIHRLKDPRTHGPTDPLTKIHRPR